MFASTRLINFSKESNLLVLCVYLGLMSLVRAAVAGSGCGTERSSL